LPIGIDVVEEATVTHVLAVRTSDVCRDGITVNRPRAVGSPLLVEQREQLRFVAIEAALAIPRRWWVGWRRRSWSARSVFRIRIALAGIVRIEAYVARCARRDAALTAVADRITPQRLAALHAILADHLAVASCIHRGTGQSGVAANMLTGLAFFGRRGLWRRFGAGRWFRCRRWGTAAVDLLADVDTGVDAVAIADISRTAQAGAALAIAVAVALTRITGTVYATIS